jgi:rhodanese-related sulfurtransferase
MKKAIVSALLAASLGLSAHAYDAKQADSFNGFYSKLTQQACASSKLFIDGEETMKMIRDNADILLLDVRTDGEASVLALSTPNSLHIPLASLFQKANLDRLPTDRTIVIVCHSGTRATMAAMALKQLGFKQTRVLKGGMIALAEANNPKNAPLK